MGNQTMYNKIKTIIHSYIPDAQVLLFGSRIKDTAHQDSDYDLLIIVNNEFTLPEKLELESKIDKALVWALDVPFDVILKDKSEIERYKYTKGHIIYYALKEAVAI